MRPSSSTPEPAYEVLATPSTPGASERARYSSRTRIGITPAVCRSSDPVRPRELGHDRRGPRGENAGRDPRGARRADRAAELSALARGDARLISFTDIASGTSFELRRIDVRTALLAHPGGATGFRIEHEGRSVAYVTDTEHDPLRLDGRILALIEGADLVIYDCTYTDEEFDAHRGWGHSTWQEVVRLCRAAGAKRLAILHHDPAHDDGFMKHVGHAAKRTWSGACVAREGAQIDLCSEKSSGGKRRRLR